VGLGLGLQKIASNYVSGFIILLDRSVRIGDNITVDNRSGQVTEITTRYVVLKSPDGTEALIPNDTLVTSTVVNQSYTDRKLRVAIPVQVSYRSDLEQAMAILVDAARRQPRVLADPEPSVALKEFADSGINLELGAWISDPEEGRIGLVSAINLEIWREFRRQGIEIPFPQREVRLLGTQTVS
jgi:small-conductance mechanosensitive channel